MITRWMYLVILKCLVKKMKLARGHEPFTVTFITLIMMTTLLTVIFRLDGKIFFVGVIVLSAIEIFILFFHRDPERSVPSLPEDIILSPADGKIHEVIQGATETVIRIRMNVLNVHVNRMPLTGTIKEIKEISGKHWPFFGFINRGTIANARKVTTITSKWGYYEIIQISGFLARRCVIYHPVGTTIQRGDRFGMIRFGSEVDVRFKQFKCSLEILVKKGQLVKAGQTPIARIISEETNYREK